MPTLTPLSSPPHSTCYSVRLTSLPPPTPRFRHFALSCGLPFLNTLTFSSFVRNVRAEYAPTP